MKGHATPSNHDRMTKKTGREVIYVVLLSGSAGNQLFVYIQTVTSLLAPPIAMVFSLGIAWPGLTEAGALSGLLCGFVLGMTKFIMRKAYGTPHCGEEDNRPAFVKIHFMYYGKALVSNYKFSFCVSIHFLQK